MVKRLFISSSTALVLLTTACLLVYVVRQVNEVLDALYGEAGISR